MKILKELFCFASRISFRFGLGLGIGIVIFLCRYFRQKMQGGLDSINNLNQESFLDHYSNYGLPNLGNTCYLNSILQILLNTKEFTDLLKNAKSELGKSLYSLYKNRNKTAKRKYLNEFIYKCFKLNSKWAKGEQKDSKEFFLFVLSSMRNSGDLELTNIFYSKKESKYESICDKNLKSNSTFCFINAGHSDINCFFNKKLTKHIDKGEGFQMEYYCEGCKKNHICEETFEIQMPKILCIYFDSTYPQTVNIKDLFIIRTNDYILKFYALLRRTGQSQNFGHATTCYLKKNNLYCFDDENVYQLKPGEIRSPYMIFFRVRLKE